MKKNIINKIEWIGWLLLILLMIPFVLLLMAEPLQYGDEPEMTWTMGWIVDSWLGLVKLFIFILMIRQRRFHCAIDMK